MFRRRSVAVGAFGVLLVLGGCDQLFSFERGAEEPPPVRDLVVGEIATEVVVDRDEVFWLTAHELRSCQLPVCSPRTLLGSLTMPVALRVAGEQVEYAEGSMVYRVPRVGGAKSQVVESQNGRTIISFVQLQSRLFYTHERISVCTYVADGPCTFTSGLFVEIFGPIVADATQRIWGAGPASGGGWGMYVIVNPATTADTLQLVSTSSVAIRAIAASVPRVFAIQATGDEVLEWPATAGRDTQPTVALVVPAASAIAVDAASVWVASATGEVWRRRLVDGPDQAVLITKDSVVIRALAVGTDVAVVAMDDRISAFDVPAL